MLYKVYGDLTDEPTDELSELYSRVHRMQCLLFVFFPGENVVVERVQMEQIGSFTGNREPPARSISQGDPTLKFEYCKTPFPPPSPARILNYQCFKSIIFSLLDCHLAAKLK